MSGRIKIKPKDKDKRPKIDVFKVIESRFKNMNELRDLIDMDPRKGLVRIRDGAGFRWISLLRMTVLSLTYIFSTSSSQKKILILCSVSLNMIVVLFQRYKFLISGQRQYMEKPKRTGGGGRTGEARKDEVSLLPLGLHYPYRYSIVTMRTFPIGIRFTSRTKISYYTIIV